MRVGYAQSNFNADNCLVSGRTVDFGPFGFIEKYDPGWAMWIGSGDHFGFMNQPRAAHANYVRGAHYPQDQLFLDMCDEAGIMVWEEAQPDPGKNQFGEPAWRAAVMAQIDEMVTASTDDSGSGKCSASPSIQSTEHTPGTPSTPSTLTQHTQHTQHTNPAHPACHPSHSAHHPQFLAGQPHEMQYVSVTQGFAVVCVVVVVARESHR